MSNDIQIRALIAVSIHDGDLESVSYITEISEDVLRVFVSTGKGLEPFERSVLRRFYEGAELANSHMREDAERRRERGRRAH